MQLTLNRMAAGLVGVAMVAGLAFAFAAERAHASQLSELVELFITLGIVSDDKAVEAREALAAMEEAAPADEATTPSLATAMSCSFTRNLSTGATGQDVMDLQKLLNAKGFKVAAAGAGSPGMETSYYGPATAAAVAAMQTAFASEILAPLGLTTGTGYFGASTRAKANALCAVETPDVPEVPSEDDDDMFEDDDDMGDEDTDLSGEASLYSVEISDADDSDIEENQEDAEVAELDVEFRDGDAMITRLDVALVGETGAEPWKAFDTVSLWVDGEKVAEQAADDEDEYLDEDAGSIRFTGLDIVAMEDDEVTITVAVTTMNGLDADEIGDWDVQALSIRFVDGDDVTSTESETGDLQGGTPTADVATFTIEEEGGDDELIVKSASSDPDAGTIKVEDDKKSDFTTIFAFDLDSDDSTNDIEVNEITVNVAATEDGTTATSAALLINDVQLVVDGEEYDDVTITAQGLNGKYVFDIDGDLVIEAGDRVTVEFQAEFLSLDAPLEGATVQASTTADTIDAEGADTLTVVDGQLSGSSTGDEHTLRTTGAVIEFVSATTDVLANSDTTTADDEGKFVVKVDVTAFESDIYIAKTAASSTGTGSGIVFIITDGAGNPVGTSSTPIATLSSSGASETGTDSTSRYVVDEGETETFTITVEYDPVVAGSYAVQVYGVNYKTANTAAATVTQSRALPAEDFETDPEII